MVRIHQRYPLVSLLLLLLCSTASAQYPPHFRGIGVKFANCAREGGVLYSHTSVAGAPDYDAQRNISLVQGLGIYPMAYFRPGSEEDVQVGVKCATENNMPICVRSGGHSWSGASTCPGLVIDMQRLVNQTVNTADGWMEVGAGRSIGQTLYDLNEQTGRVIPTGTCPSVGLAGFVQGGGLGILSGIEGLLSDNVLAYTVVTADGRILRNISPSYYAGLFWALRGGGGGHLALVTSIRVKIHDPTIGELVKNSNVYFAFRWPREQMAAAMHAWMEYAEKEDGRTWIRMVAYHGRFGVSVRVSGICWGTPYQFECWKRLEQLSLWSVPGRETLLMHTATHGMIEAQKFIGRDGLWGTRVPTGPMGTKMALYRRFDNPKSVMDDRSRTSTMWGYSAMDRADTAYFQGLLEKIALGQVTAGMRSLSLEMSPLGKAVRSGSAGAFAHRAALALVTSYFNGGETSVRNTVKKSIKDHLAPFSMGTYVNYPDATIESYQEQYWGRNVAILSKLKTQWDPENRLFQRQGIPQASAVLAV